MVDYKPFFKAFWRFSKGESGLLRAQTVASARLASESPIKPLLKRHKLAAKPWPWHV
jgi:hypothetical protein